MERIHVYQILNGERDYQDDKWAEKNELNGIPDAGKSVSEWLGFIEYHINKAKTCVYNIDQQGALAEMRKITALGVKAMEALDCPEREGYERLTTTRDYWCSTFHPRKMKFVIPIGNMPDDEIDAYIVKIAGMYKNNTTSTLSTDGLDLIVPDSDIFMPEKPKDE
jgi:hypothetical protein